MPRKVPYREMVHDLKLIIDLSCMTSDTIKLFEEFHGAVLAVIYDATDVSIDYEKKSICMNLPDAYAKGDFLKKFDQSTVKRTLVNVDYNSLANFLKGSMDQIGLKPNLDYYALYAYFAKGRSRVLDVQYMSTIAY